VDELSEEDQSNMAEVEAAMQEEWQHIQDEGEELFNSLDPKSWVDPSASLPAHRMSTEEIECARAQARAALSELSQGLMGPSRIALQHNMPQRPVSQ
jgi:glutamyl-tRNA reductase